MTSTSDALPQPAAAARPRGRRISQRRWHQAVAVLLAALGGLLLAGNLGLLRAEAQQAGQLIWAGVLLLAGLWLVVTRGRPALMALEPFALDRGEIQRARLTATMGAA